MPVLLAKLVAWLATLYTFFRRSRIGNYALLATSIVATLAAFAFIKTIVVSLAAGLSVSMPGMMPVIFSWFVPYNLDDCISARLSLEAALSVYRWKKEIIDKAYLPMGGAY